MLKFIILEACFLGTYALSAENASILNHRPNRLSQQYVTASNTLTAECDFGPFGAITIKEKASDPNGPPTNGDAKRTVSFSGSLENLCRKAQYSLTVHSYTNTGCKCTKLGPLLGKGREGIIDRGIRTNRHGGVSISTGDKPFSLIPTHVDPISLLSGSCMLKLSRNCPECPKGCPKVLCTAVDQVSVTQTA